MPSPPAPNPFVGPRPILANERLFGRDTETRALYDLLQARRIVVLHSPSGAGKSSLVQAGLYRMLREARFDVWRVIRVNLEPQGEEGVGGANQYVLSAMLSLEEELPAEHRRPAAVLANMSLREYLDSRPRRRGRADMPVVLVFDQFEEILTVAPRKIDEKRGFFEALGNALDGGHYWALFCIREDYLGALAPYRQYLPTQLANTFRLDLLTLEGAAEAAVRLAEQGHRAFPGVDQLIADLSAVKVQVGDDPPHTIPGIHVEPVYLQVVCRRLWASLPPERDRIEAEDVVRYAEVSTALGTYYDEAVAKVAGADQALERRIRDWIGTRLIVGGIRSLVGQDVERAAGLEGHHVRELLDSYVIRTEQRAGASWYELSHDRLVEPVLVANEKWEEAHLHALQRQTRLWVDAHRADAQLASAEALRSATGWLRENAGLLTNDERDFVARSQRARRAEVTARRSLIATAAVFAALFVAAAATGVWAFDQKGKADASARNEEIAANIAKKAADEAERRREEAVVATNEAKAARDEALIQSTLAESRRLQAVSAARAARRASDEATHERTRAIAAAKAANDSLEQARDSARRLAVTQLDGDSLRMAPFLVNYSAQSDPWWRAKATWVFDHPASLERLPPKTHWRRPTFSPGGDKLALVEDRPDGGVWLWSYLRDAEPTALPGLPGPVRALAFSPDGRWLAATADAGAFVVWDVATGAAAHTGSLGTTVWDLAFSPDSARLVGGGVDGNGYVWGAGGWESPTITRVAPPQKIWAVDATDKRWLAASGDGAVRVYAWGETSPLLSTDTDGCRLRSLTDASFRPGADEILMFGASEVLRRWPFGTGLPCGTLTAKGEIRQARYSPGGERILTVVRGEDGPTNLVRTQGEDWPPRDTLRDRTGMVLGALMADFLPGAGDGGAVLLAGGRDAQFQGEASSAAYRNSASIVELDARERPARRISLAGHAAPVQDVAFGRRDSTTQAVPVATVDEAGEVRIWSHTEDQLHRSVLEKSDGYARLASAKLRCDGFKGVQLSAVVTQRRDGKEVTKEIQMERIRPPVEHHGAPGMDATCPTVEEAQDRYGADHIRPIVAVCCDTAENFIATASDNGVIIFRPNRSVEELTRKLEELVGKNCLEEDLKVYLTDDLDAWPPGCARSTADTPGSPAPAASRARSDAPAEDWLPDEAPVEQPTFTSEVDAQQCEDTGERAPLAQATTQGGCGCDTTQRPPVVALSAPLLLLVRRRRAHPGPGAGPASARVLRRPP